MQLDLNILLEEIYSWKTLLKERDEKIENLQNEIIRSCKQNKVLEDTHKTLLFEISEFNNALSALHSSISRLEDYEADKKLLTSEKKKLENYIEELKKLHEKQLEEMKEEIKQIKLDYKKETETELLQIESKASAKHENYLNRIKEKDNYIVKLEDDISRIKNEKDQDVLKIKIEYEDQINKMKAKLSKSKGSHPIQNDFRKDDIFRQKYIKIEKESREVIVDLKKQIEELQLQIATLKSDSSIPIHPLLQNSIPVINSTTNNERSRKNTEQYLCGPKRLKIGHEDHTNVVVNANDVDFNVKNQPVSNQITVIKPIKKKLFNIDLNYY